jgi:hypothetical protein
VAGLSRPTASAQITFPANKEKFTVITFYNISLVDLLQQLLANRHFAKCGFKHPQFFIGYILFPNSAFCSSTRTDGFCTKT